LTANGCRCAHESMLAGAISSKLMFKVASSCCPTQRALRTRFTLRVRKRRSSALYASLQGCSAKRAARPTDEHRGQAGGSTGARAPAWAMVAVDGSLAQSAGFHLCLPKDIGTRCGTACSRSERRCRQAVCAASSWFRQSGILRPPHQPPSPLRGPSAGMLRDGYAKGRCANASRWAA
jgi:hypothetical protein